MPQSTRCSLSWTHDLVLFCTHSGVDKELQDGRNVPDETAPDKTEGRCRTHSSDVKQHSRTDSSQSEMGDADRSKEGEVVGKVE